MRHLILAATTVGTITLSFPCAAQNLPPLPSVALDAEVLRATQELRVLLVAERLDAEQFQDLSRKHHLPLYREAMASDQAADGRPHASSGDSLSEGVIMWAFVSQLAIIGGLQQRIRENRAVDALVTPEHARFRRLHDAALDARVLDGLVDALEQRSALRVTERSLVRIDPEAPDGAPRDWDFRAWLATRDASDPRPLLVIRLRHAMPRTLAGVWGISDVQLLQAPVRVGAPSRAQRRAYQRFGVLGLGSGTQLFARAFGVVASPVPYADLRRPPDYWVDAQVAAIEAEYNPEIEKATDFGYRRALRTKRNSLLEEVRGPWLELDQAEFMQTAWNKEPREAYTRVVGSAFERLGRRVVDSLCAEDPEGMVCRAPAAPTL